MDVNKTGSYYMLHALDHLSFGGWFAFTILFVGLLWLAHEKVFTRMRKFFMMEPDEICWFESLFFLLMLLMYITMLINYGKGLATAC